MHLEGVRDQLIARMPAHERADVAKQIIAGALSIAGEAKARSQQLDGDRNLSREGRQSAMRAEVAKTFAPRLKNVSQGLEALLTAQATARGAIALKPTDESNMVAEQRRQEKRRHLLGLSGAERMAFLFADVQGAGHFAEAMLRDEPALSGLNAIERKRIEETYLNKHFGPQIKNAETLDELVTGVQSALQIAGLELRNAADLDDRAFAELTKQAA